MLIGSVIAAIIFICLGGFLYYITLGFPPPYEGQQNIPGPAYFPQMLIYCLWALTLLLLFRLWQGKEVIRAEWKNVHLMVISALAMILCAFIIERVGFLVVMPIYLVFHMRLLFYKQWKHIIILSAAATLFVYVVFYKILNVPLPLGVLENFK
ncbi:MAG: tripartite tricarboxylate transporter TctB family protein [Deltaproteobacteria bacterium]|nr:tripartite tricarboxylate transporter TctB family protein [Deltaproteobacteria bacterium]MBW2308829.1 tripartite tricarboxylate transporter TctB family protein [Deltaproteobacteria bacterium]